MVFVSNKVELMQWGGWKENLISAGNGLPSIHFITIHFNDFAVLALKFQLK
jgi:hypothetical protein